MHQSKTRLGLFGAFGIMVTAGLALPFVNVLKMFTPAQLMVVRGFLTAALTFAMLRGAVRKGADTYTYLIAVVLPFATLGLFQGIRHWGAGPTIIMITMTPLLNLTFALYSGRKISQDAVIGFILLLWGVGWAQRFEQFVLVGFAWATFGTIMNGVLYELFARTKSGLLQICFWACFGTGVLGLALSTTDSWASFTDAKTAILLFGFAFVGGFLYWMANLIAFRNLPTIEASILAQGETPAVMVGASIFLGETMSLAQWADVTIALFGASWIVMWLKKIPEEKAV